MLQEILTYMIIGSAVTLAVIKIYNQIRVKRKPQKSNSQNNKTTIQHNCSGCTADCMLRDMPTQNTAITNEVCKKVDINL